MPVQMNMDGLKLLSLTKEQAAWLKGFGVEVHVYPKGVKFAKDGEVLATIEMNFQTVSALKAGTANIAVKKALAESVNGAFNVITKKIEVPVQAPNSVGEQYTTGGTVTGSLPEKAVFTAHQYKKPTWPTTPELGDAAFAPFPVDAMKSAAKIQLADATRLYQPVYGSSKTSRYYLVAATDDLKLAARLSNGKLSVRVEGDITKHATEIAAAGFILNGNYASMHLSVPSSLIAAKALGAVISAIPVKFRTLMPQFSLIEGGS